MRRICVSALLVSGLCVPALADPLKISPDSYVVNQGGTVAAAADAAPGAAAPSSSGSGEAGMARYADAAPPQPPPPAGPNLGGGLFEFLFGNAERRFSASRGEPEPAGDATRQDSALRDDPGQNGTLLSAVESGHPPVDPKFDRQVVSYDGKEHPGTIIIDTPNKFLYLVEDGGKALRYGIGVGRPGFTWSGVKTISSKREWPDWRPPDDMLARRPDLPRYMAGGPENPLGARAMYLGSTLYRIHGSNEPWTIGSNVSSGCIRLRNADVIDLYNRVKVGAKVVVI